MAPDQLAGIIFGASIVAYFAIGIYFLPTIVGIVRRVDDLVVLIVTNLLLGWTFVGWVGALVKALGPSKPKAAASKSAQSASPPMLSPDGKFWWDGQTWQPMPGVGRDTVGDRPAVQR